MLRSTGRVPAAFLATVLLPATCLAALTGEIRGKILSPAGEALEGVYVVIEETGAHRKTTGSGFFIFLGLDPGLYTIHARDGVRSKAVVYNVEIHAGLTARVSVTLCHGWINRARYSQPLLIEPVRMFVLSGSRLRTMPLKKAAEYIRTVPSRVEIYRRI